MNHLFCFGLGYCATEISDRLIRLGWSVSSTVTDADRARAVTREGLDCAIFDGQQPSPVVEKALQCASHLLLSVPPGPDGDPCLRHHGRDIAASQSLKWVGYFSTIGVYGDAGGAWVDEETPARPVSERGRRRLGAEQAWLELGKQTGKSIMVFRLPGIYGPGRSVFDDLRAGTARRIVKPGQVFNRAYRDDIARAVVAAISHPRPGRVYNITDDEPCPPQDVVTYAALLLGLAPPPEIAFADAGLTAMARSFYGESKRVSNARLKSELGIELECPNYREGLETILRRER